MKNANASLVRRNLLDTALKLVPQHGWTVECLAEAAHVNGLSRASHGLVEEGALGFISHHVRQCNESLAGAVREQHSDDTLATMTKREKLKVVAETRLRMTFEKVDSWDEALSVLAHPKNMPTSLELLHETSDEIWHVSGDISTDLNWYAKRAMLSGVYSASEMFMLTDRDESKEETVQFLHAQIDQMVDGYSKLSSLSEYVPAFLYK